MIRLITLSLALLPAALFAQEPAPAVDYDDRIVEACLAQHWGNQNAQESCIGIAARACMPPGEGDAATAVACFDAERAQWDARLTQTLDSLRAQYAPEPDAVSLGETTDETEALAGETSDDGDASAADTSAADATAADAIPADPLTALETAQSAWIAWRDAACALDASVYPGTDIAQTARADCLMRLTGRQVFHLMARLEGAS